MHVELGFFWSFILQTYKTGNSGAYAGGCTGCTCTPPPPTWEKSFAQKCPKEKRKFRPDMSAKKNVRVPLRYHKIKTKKLGTVNFLEPKVYTIKGRPLLTGKWRQIATVAFNLGTWHSDS